MLFGNAPPRYNECRSIRLKIINSRHCIIEVIVNLFRLLWQLYQKCSFSHDQIASYEWLYRKINIHKNVFWFSQTLINRANVCLCPNSADFSLKMKKSPSSKRKMKKVSETKHKPSYRRCFSDRIGF